MFKEYTFVCKLLVIIALKRFIQTKNDDDDDSMSKVLKIYNNWIFKSRIENNNNY